MASNNSKDSLSISTKRLILSDYIENRIETDFMKEVLLPLFDNMQYEVIYNHGPNELGKDFVLRKVNELGEEEIFCVVVKNGDISGSTRGSANIAEVKRQVEQSLETELDEFGFKSRLPNKVLVFTPGKISSQARREIAQNRGVLNSTKVSFFWDEKLIQLIDKYYPFLFQVALPSTAKYLADLVGHIETITTIDPSFSDLLNLANLKCVKESKSALETKGPRVTENPEDIAYKGSFSWLQGGTGSGKTFTVYRIAQRALGKLKSDAIRKKGTVTELQLPIYLKAFHVSNFKDGKTVEQFLFEQMQTYSTSCSENDVKDWLRDFDVVVVFDEYEFKSPQAELNAFIKSLTQFPNASVLVLSRILSESQIKFDRPAEIWQMRELNLANARKVLLSSIPSENKKAVQLYNDMLGNGVLERVPKTPLALNVLNQVFSGHVNSTPVNMFEFFDMFFELVLGRWEPRRDLDSALDYNQIRGFLQEVAFEMVSTNKLSIPVMMLLPMAEKILQSTRNTTLQPLEFIENVAKYGEVAIIRDNEFSFTQRTFMEFLAGCEFEKHHWQKEFIIDKITDINWEDTLLFAAGSKKKNDDLLDLVSQIKESTASELFFKMKNIAGLTLALYRSDNAKKMAAIKEGLRTAVKLRDDQNFDKSIKAVFRDERDLTVSLVCLSLFSTYYGKNGLADLLTENLKDNASDREKFYALSALLETLDTKSDLTTILPFVPQDVNSQEGLAFGPFIQIEAKQSQNSEPIKSLLKEKEVKKLADKAIEILREERQEKTKFIP